APPNDSPFPVPQDKGCCGQHPAYVGSIDHADLTKSEIQRLGVSVGTFDPNNDDSLGRETQWLSSLFSRRRSNTPEAKVVQSSLNIPNLVRALQHRPDWDVTVATQEVLYFITAQFDFCCKSKTHLRNTFGWSDIESSLAAVWDCFSLWVETFEVLTSRAGELA
ncbi:hypothetical protein N7491_003147, partial [Penicillium cf. griseofulvum]